MQRVGVGNLPLSEENGTILDVIGLLYTNLDMKSLKDMLRKCFLRVGKIYYKIQKIWVQP